LCEEKNEPDSEMHNAKVKMTEFWNSNLKEPIFSHFSLPIENAMFNVTARSISIFNLHRLGLINTDYIERIIPPNDYIQLYYEVINSDYYNNAKNVADERNLHVCLTRGYTSPTQFGRLFGEICCA